MPLKSTRRGFLGGLLSAFAAPAIVRIDNIMPVRAYSRPGTHFVGPNHPWYDHPSWLELRRRMEINSIGRQLERPPQIYAQHFDAMMKGLLPGGLPLGESRYSVPPLGKEIDSIARRGKWVGVCEPTDIAWLKGHGRSNPSDPGRTALL